MNALQGQVVVVNGASRGMGAAIAQAFAAEGAKVGLMARTEADLEAVAESIRAAGGTAEVAVADIRKRAQVVAAVAKLRAALGPVDILVNSSGLAVSSELAEMTEEDWDVQWDTNVKGVMLCSQAVVMT